MLIIIFEVPSNERNVLKFLFTIPKNEIIQPYIYAMDIFTFRASLSTATPPPDISVYLLSLWHDAKGNWDNAHDAIQHIDTRNASWVHAYLHRKEGDIFNADYWYSKAGKKRPSSSLDDEWNELAEAFLNDAL